jgi:hypothetical protein
MYTSLTELELVSGGRRFAKLSKATDAPSALTDDMPGRIGPGSRCTAV